MSETMGLALLAGTVVVILLQSWQRQHGRTHQL